MQLYSTITIGGVDVSCLYNRLGLPEARTITLEVTPMHHEEVIKQRQVFMEALEEVEEALEGMTAEVRNKLASRIRYLRRVGTIGFKHTKWVHPLRIPKLVVTRRGKKQNAYIRMVVHEDYIYPLAYTDVPVLREDVDKIEKPCAAAIGPIIDDTPFIANYRSKNAMIAGGFKRVWHEYSYDEDLVKEFGDFVDNYIQSHFTPIPEREMSHEYMDEWLEDSKYTLAQKKIFHDFLDKIKEEQNPLQYLKKNCRLYNKCYQCGTFIKKELLDEEKYPRLINPRPDEFKAIVAPYIKTIEHEVIYNKHFIKGKLPEEVVERMKQIQENFLYLYETDYSSFEGSFTLFFQQHCEMLLFNYMLSKNPKIQAIVNECYLKKNVLILGKEKDKAMFEGSRMSGDMWTSLCNGFTNKMLLEFCIAKTAEKINNPIQYDYIVEGDDGFIGINQKVDFSYVKDLGFKLKMIEANDSNNLSFCGHRYSPDGTHFADFWFQIRKFGWSFDHVVLASYSGRTTNYEAALMRAKALSLLVNCGGMPILQELCVKIINLTEGVQVKTSHFDPWFVQQYHIERLDHLSYFKPVTSETRVYFQEVYGVEVREQIRIEEEIRKQTCLRFRIPIKKE